MNNKTNNHTQYRILSLVFVLILSLGLTVSALAYTWTEPPDAAPGTDVVLYGDNRDNVGYAVGDPVHVDVINNDTGWTTSFDTIVLSDTSVSAFPFWKHTITLSANPEEAVGAYTYTATFGTQGLFEVGHFTDGNPSADLDQCANDPSPSPSSDGCSASASDWVNGNLGASKSVYLEGDSIPYRLKFGSLPLTSHTVTIEWDTTKSGTHAIDYLTTFNRSVVTADPCLGISSCNSGIFTTFPIPADPQVTGAGVTPVAGNFTMYGGTITAVSAYSYADGSGFTGDKSARITITFTASVADPVLAWGGHISTRSDWGLDGSAVTIPGSPYHTRLIALNGSGGNQDRSLSADAVIFPGSFAVIKDATPNGSTSFGFTASPSPLTGFTLVDDGTSANTKLFSNITTFGTYTVDESSIPAGWAFDSVSCSVTSANGGSYNTNTTTVNVDLREGENWTCTYLDSQRTGTLTVIKHVVNDNGGTATADQWSLHVKSGANDVAGSPLAGSESGSQYTLAGGTYTVSETGSATGYTFTGFSGDCDVNGNVTVVVGQNKTCTLTNNDQTAHLRLVKVVVNDHGGTAVATDFTLSASGPTPISGAGGAESDVNAGTYSLSESGPSGYATTGYDCGASVTLALGESRTCTITNNDISAHLTLVKTVTNDNGGTAVATDFTLSASGPTPISGAGGASSDVNTGTYNLSETNLPGYTAGSWSCVGGTQNGASVSLALGQSATCTINNDDQTAHLKLVKTVTNDNGGTAVATDFTLSAAGPTPISGAGGAESDVNAGSYNLSETNLPGYTAGAWSCVGGTQNGASVSLALGQSAVCTINNDDQTAQLTLVKTVTNDNGGTALVTDFTLSASGPTPLSGAGGASSDVNAGTYTLSETNVAGYDAGTWTCVGGTQNGATVSLALGQLATCTINNNDIAPKLHLRKIVVNNNGGIATAADFTLTADGTASNDLSGHSSVDSGAGLQADTFALSETGPSGYAASAWVCDGGTQSGSSITLGIGGEATCTITNDDIPPQLHLRKVVVNDNGGTATVADFTLSADGTGSNDLSGNSPVDSGAGLQADTFALSESGPSGYAASAWVCDGGTQNGSNITLGIGGEATCTITNDDIAPKLHLRKVVINNNGGTATAADFTLTADGTGSNDLSGTSPVDSGTSLQADTFALSETSVNGYAASAWSCVGGTQNGSNITLGIGGEATCTITNDDIQAKLALIKTVVNDNGGTAVVADFQLFVDTTSVVSGVKNGFDAGTYTASETELSGYEASDWSGACAADGSVTLNVGDDKTCYITNNDIAPKLHLRKVVINDNGGTATLANFTLTADGTGLNDLSGTSPVDSGASLQADTFALSETGPAGYSASAWSCVGGTQDGSNISVGIGGEATCTITNDDVTAHLKLVKTVTNDNGGTAVTTDFVLSAAGPTPLSGAGGAESDVDAGTYNLSETSLPGYTAGSWVCVGGTQNGASISLALGQSATCTINNNDIAPKLHLRKVVINDNGGTATLASFTLTANGSGANDLSGTSPVDSGATLIADTFALSETGPSGYAASAWSCVGGTQNGSNITVGIGGEATCTITNDDIAPVLQLRKVVINDNGGTATVADFTLTANGTGSNDLSGTSPVNSGASLQADTFALSETSLYGYSASAWVCVGGTQNGSNITLGVGQTANCTITNNDQPGTIVIIKNAKPAQGSFAFTTTGTGYSSFTLTGATTNGGNQNSQTLNAGTYTVLEGTQLGWILTGIGGSTNPNTPYNCVVTGSGGSTGVGDLNTLTATISLKNGDTVTCTFENTGAGATRTQGFWATHPQLAQIAWFGGTAFGHTFPGVAATTGIGDMTLCGRPVDTLGKLMGGFWSDVAKKSNGAKRTALDQARMQLLQQLLSAELNASAFGSVPAGGSGMFAQWESALCGTNTTAIKVAQQQAASFNTSGDSALFTPGTSADSKYARSVANIPFWDIIKP